MVFGGNLYRQNEKLGPQLQSALPQPAQVWPIAAGSWALRNELAWLSANLGVVEQMSAIVLVVNSGDFAEASSWSCELTHPTHKPAFALGYLFEKYVYTFRPCDGLTPSALKVPPGDLRKELQVFLSGRADKVLFAWYPDKAEQADVTLRKATQDAQLALLQSAGANPKNLVSIADDKRWTAAIYKDGIHPLPEGNQVLAQVLKDALVRAELVYGK